MDKATLPNSKAATGGELFRTFVSAPIVVTAIAFVAGYAFWLGYYKQFNLDISSIEQPFWTIALGAFTAYLYAFNSLAKIEHMLIFLGFYFACYAAWKLKPWNERPSLSQKMERTRVFRFGIVVRQASFDLIGVLISLFAVVFVPFGIGGRAGKQEFDSPSTKAKLYFKSGKPVGFPEPLIDANNSGRLRLLVQTRDLVIVFMLPPEKGDA